MSWGGGGRGPAVWRRTAPNLEQDLGAVRRKRLKGRGRVEYHM